MQYYKALPNLVFGDFEDKEWLTLSTAQVLSDVVSEMPPITEEQALEVAMMRSWGDVFDQILEADVLDPWVIVGTDTEEARLFQKYMSAWYERRREGTRTETMPMVAQKRGRRRKKTSLRMSDKRDKQKVREIVSGIFRRVCIATDEPEALELPEFPTQTDVQNVTKRIFERILHAEKMVSFRERRLENRMKRAQKKKERYHAWVAEKRALELDALAARFWYVPELIEEYKIQRDVEDYRRKIARQFETKRRAYLRRQSNWKRVTRVRRCNRFAPVKTDAFERSCKRAFDFWDVELQGPSPARAQREQQQRDAAKKRQKTAVPKEERERNIKAQRDKRNPALQSGKLLTAAAGAGIAMVATRLWRFLGSAKGTADSAKGLLDFLKQTAEGLKTHLGKALWYIPLVLTIFFMIHKHAGTNGVVLALLIAALAKIVGPKVWAAISNFFPDGDVQLQAGPADFLEAAPKLLATLFCFSVLGNKRAGSVSEFCKRISLLERMTGGWEVFLKWMLKAIETLVNHVRRLFGKERVEFFKEAKNPIHEWAKKIDEVLLSEATGGELSAEKIDYMVELAKEGTAYKELCRGSSSARFVDDYYFKITSALVPYNGSLNSRKNNRQEPAMLMLHGTPGIGKTLMALPLCTAIMLESGLLPRNAGYDDVTKQVWQKGSSEFWNGYVGQKCMVIDDAFQARANVADKDNDFMAVIRMVSTWSFPLNFADLNSKGKIYFDSKFIFATTNLSSIDSEAKIVVHEPDAVARRINFPYTMKVKDEFVLQGAGGRRLDYQKYLRERQRCASNEAAIDRFPWYIWEVAKHDYISGQTSPLWRPLKEVLLEVAEDIRRRTESFQDEADGLRNFLAGYAQETSREEAARKVAEDMSKDTLSKGIRWQPDLGQVPECIHPDDLVLNNMQGQIEVQDAPPKQPPPPPPSVSSEWEGVEEVREGIERLQEVADADRFEGWERFQWQGEDSGDDEPELQFGRRMPKDSNIDGFDITMFPEDTRGYLRGILMGDDIKRVLRLPRNAGHDDFVEAYRRVIRLIHPDKVDQYRLQGARRDAAIKVCTEASQRFNDAADKAFRRHREEFQAEYVRDMWDRERIMFFLKVALGVVLTSMAAKLFYTVVKSILGGLWTMLTKLFGFNRKNKKEKKNKNKDEVAAQSNRPLTGVRRAGLRDPSLQSVDSTVATNIYGNSYKMYATLTSGTELVIGQVIFLMGTLAVQPEHFTERIRQSVADQELTLESTLVLRNALQNQFTIPITVKQYLELKRTSAHRRDVEFLDFANVRAHRNVVNNFFREVDLRHLPGYRCRLDICEVDAMKRIVPENKRQIYILSSIGRMDSIRAGGKFIERTWHYAAPTTAGDCGAPLCVLDNSLHNGRTCLGIHVAGDASREVGYSAVVTQEMIRDAAKSMKTIEDRFEQDLADRKINLQACAQLPFNKKGSFLPIGVVDKPVVICPKTSYYPTNLFGTLGEYDHLPAHLSPVWKDGELIYPMENAVAPYSSEVHIFDQPWLKQALHVAMTPLTQLTRDMPRDILTYEEAVCGIPERKFRALPRGTAAGFPYVYDVRNGKKEFFGEDQEYDLSRPMAKELEKRVDYIIEMAKSGVRLATVYVDFLKDELRTPAKVEAVATRLISSAPLDYTIAWRRYFGAFSSAVMRVHTRTGMAPGINVFTDWSMLAEQLQRKGLKCFDGDFKAFDSSEQPAIHALILDYINRWYDDGPENALVRRVLWEDLVHSRHIGGTGCDQRHIYQWNKSLPSGHPFTTIVNSMYSLFCLVAAYISVTGDLTGFWDHVSSVVYGDDNVSNVDDETAEVFNQVTVAQALEREFKMKYTPGNKTGDFEPTVDISSLTFLKRAIVERDNRWLAPLELESFLYTCYWCKNRKLEKSIMIAVLENALQELSLHDERVWNEYAHKIADILGMRGHVTQALVEQDQYLNLVLSRTDSWY